MKSFITLITIIDLITFLISVIGSEIQYGSISTGYFLGPNGLLI